jgi:hypothetical protein
MTAPTTFPEPNPEWVLEALINFLVGEFEDAAAEYVQGRPHFIDTDRMKAHESALAFLFGLSGGRYGLSTDQLAAIRTEAAGGAR